MNKNNLYIYLDDVRPCPQSIKDAYTAFTARDYWGAIDLIEFCVYNNVKFYIDFDH